MRLERGLLSPFRLFSLLTSTFPSNSDGVTHPCTRSEPPSLHRVIKFISLTILDMSIARIRTARKMKRHGQREGVRVIHMAVSVSFFQI